MLRGLLNSRWIVLLMIKGGSLLLSSLPSFLLPFLLTTSFPSFFSSLPSSLPLLFFSLFSSSLPFSLLPSLVSIAICRRIWVLNLDRVRRGRDQIRIGKGKRAQSLIKRKLRAVALAHKGLGTTVWVPRFHDNGST
jgi:hypothetical protein